MRVLGLVAALASLAMSGPSAAEVADASAERLPGQGDRRHRRAGAKGVGFARQYRRVVEL